MSAPRAAGTDDAIAALFARAWLDDAELEAGYRRFVVDGVTVGWMRPSFVAALAPWPSVFVARGDGGLELASHLHDAGTRTAAVAEVVTALAADGVIRGWRDERYAVRAGPDATGPVLFTLERAAARAFGITSEAVHVNGIVADAGGAPHSLRGAPRSLWIARRSPGKAIDPGMLDNLVGGGIAAALGVRETLVKEAWEEAGFEPALAERATRGGRLRIRRASPEGLQSEVVHVHDLVVPADTPPRNVDGEVAEFRRISIDEAIALIARGDAMTADASLVTLDWLDRMGLVALPDVSRRHAIFGR